MSSFESSGSSRSSQSLVAQQSSADRGEFVQDLAEEIPRETDEEEDEDINGKRPAAPTNEADQAPGLSSGSRRTGESYRAVPGVQLDATRPTWSEFLQEASSAHPNFMSTVNDNGEAETPSMDRKRRLTGSPRESGRVRTISGSYHHRRLSGRSLPINGPSSPQMSAWPRRTDSTNLPRDNFIDLTVSPPPPGLARQPSSITPTVTNLSHITIPKWQPDSQASSCPICKRPFSFIFRRHHCRKCGRVVCNECSPHRITIARQYIVHPPTSTDSTGNEHARPSLGTETIDLTRDPDGLENSNRSQRGFPDSMSTQGGGEKVRLCNPCVPDPQPTHLATYGHSRRFENSSRDPFHPLDHENTSTSNAIFALSPYQSPFLASTGSQTGQTSEAVLIASAMNRDRPFHPPRYRHPQAEAILPPAYSLPRSRPTSASVMGLMHPGNPVPIPGYISPALRRPPSVPFAPPNHARYQSLDLATMPTPPVANRPRIRSMLDVDTRTPRFMAESSKSSSLPRHTAPRPRLDERDVCPICRRALPAVGENGDEAAREAHIMDCITSRDPGATRSAFTGSPSQGYQPQGPIHMLPFVASEKDCVAEDGTVQECSICMVEYEVGDELARLECLCKFHQQCIASWFGRKQECPVHKIL